jgi:hypothetical protein
MRFKKLRLAVASSAGTKKDPSNIIPGKEEYKNG